MENKKANTLWQRRIEPVLVVLARLVVGATFAFSGFVKSIDPAGTSLKIREYLEAFDLDFALPIAFFIAVCLGVYELILGVNLLFGSYRRVTSVLLFLTMLVMTPLTLYLALANPISDCGCFGEALYLTHWQSFAKMSCCCSCRLYCCGVTGASAAFTTRRYSRLPSTSYCFMPWVYRCMPTIISPYLTSAPIRREPTSRPHSRSMRLICRVISIAMATGWKSFLPTTCHRYRLALCRAGRVGCPFDVDG